MIDKFAYGEYQIDSDGRKVLAGYESDRAGTILTELTSGKSVRTSLVD